MSEENQLKLYWVNDSFATGRAYGFSLHGRKLKEALNGLGVAFTSEPGKADLCIHVTRPDFFAPVDGARNILFSQWEFDRPAAWSDRIAEATAVVTSCRSSAAACAQRYHGRIEVCPLGVDSALFPFHQRRQPLLDEDFVYLFVGDTDDSRKGADVVFSAWMSWLQSGTMPQNARLHIHSSGVLGGSERTPPLLALARITTEDRNLSGPELAALYNSAHCFLLPSRGEGWALCLTEALGTGLPSVWTAFSAMLDYGDSSVGFPVDSFEMTPIWPYGKFKDGPPVAHGALVDEAALIETMKSVYFNYGAALERGRRASERMHSQFTWAQAAQKFIAICERALELPITPAAGDEVSPAAIVEATASPR